MICFLKASISSSSPKFLVMSSSSQLSIDAFPAWARLNDVDFTHVKLQETEGKGFGLVAEKDLNEKEKESGDGDAKDGKSPSKETATALVRIPHDLVLSAAAVEEYAKVDQNFRQLLEIAGHQVNIPSYDPIAT